MPASVTSRCLVLSSPGLEDIPISFLKRFKYELRILLLVRFSHLLDMGQIPSL